LAAQLFGFFKSRVLSCRRIKLYENRARPLSIGRTLAHTSCFLDGSSPKKGLNCIQGFLPHTLLYPKKDSVGRAYFPLQSVNGEEALVDVVVHGLKSSPYCFIHSAHTSRDLAVYLCSKN
jgi:hypothetical protein